jgi:thiol-disulfide isomerase/thioredoxin
MILSRCAAAVAALGLLLAGPAAARIKPGQPAPAYTLTTFDKAKISSDQLKGQVVILNFWATWCGPCRQELPALDRYNRDHAKDGLRVFAVATEDSVSDSFLKPVAAALSFPLAHSIRGQGLAPLGGVPTNFVIDRHGVIRWAQAGAFDAQTLDQVIGPLLAEPIPAEEPSPASAAP